MSFPPNAEVKRSLKKLEKAEGTLAKPANPTALEKFRWDIQQKFVSYKLDRRMSQIENWHSKFINGILQEIYVGLLVL